MGGGSACVAGSDSLLILRENEGFIFRLIWKHTSFQQRMYAEYKQMTFLGYNELTTDIWMELRSRLTSFQSAPCHLIRSRASKHVKLRPRASPSSPFARCHFLGRHADNLSLHSLKRLSNSALKNTPQQWNELPHSDSNFGCLGGFMGQITAMTATSASGVGSGWCNAASWGREPRRFPTVPSTVWGVVTDNSYVFGALHTRGLKENCKYLANTWHSNCMTTSCQQGKRFERVRYSTKRNVDENYKRL